MQHLYAPWRMEYVGAAKDPGCLFCRVFEAGEQTDAQNLVVRRQPSSLTMLNKFPYNNGHLLVAPREHVASLVDLDDEQTLEVMRAVRVALQVLVEVMKPDGFNVGVNLGEVAGAGIPGHVHYHLVPRWSGDGNFMPVIGEVKVINEHLQRTWEKLHAAFQDSAAS